MAGGRRSGVVVMGVLRRLAALLIRGPDARTILGDLDEAFAREVARGMPRGRARARYARNALASALTLWGEAARTTLRRFPVRASLLDVKLGARMLVKHPGLTLVAVFALALGIPASLFPVHLLNVFFAAELPFEGGDRIVGLRYRTVQVLDDRAGSAFEYLLWRDRLTGVDGVGAARTGRYNVLAGDGRLTPLRGAEATASAFRLLGVPPLLGRPLLDTDEVTGAQDVVLIGHELWHTGFAGDPDVVGRTMAVAGAMHTVVGVMPEGFLFPLRDHFWIPLRTAPVAEPRAGPELLIFARLDDGVSEAQVAAQMESLHAAHAERFPEALGDVRPQTASYVDLVTGNSGSGEDMVLIVVWQLFTLLLLAVACGNVGTLILARTSARSGELAIRTALGAGRSRIVTQLFVESLVLALLATGVGLVAAYYVAERFDALIERSEELPFWFDFSLSARTGIAALVLAVFCAGVAGVVPALKATGGRIQGGLQRAASGRSRVRFGGVTSALIVAEVALGVASLFGGGIALLMAPRGAMPTEIEGDRLLTALVRVGSPAGQPADLEERPEVRSARIESVHREIVRRLESETGVRGAALTRTLPAGMVHPTGRVELDGGVQDVDGRGHRVQLGRVGVGYFEAVGASVVSGRSFREGDLDLYEQDGDAPVIVDATFVDRVLRGRNPIGQRVRYVARADEEPGRWHEVVGVVGEAGMSSFDLAGSNPVLYHPLPPGYPGPGLVWVVLGVEGDPANWVPRLREVAAAIDPTALIERPMPLGDLRDEGRAGIYWTLLAVGVVAGIAIVLSVAGLYALMSFTVAQRTREIGVRAALGADGPRITWLIARRAMLQLTAGIVVGAGASLLFVRGAAPELFTWLEGADIALVQAAAGVLVVGALACVVPTRRGLGIQPMDALRSD